MSETIPSYLINTYKMLESPFPDGIDERTYWLLLFVLHENMSDRILARVIADFTGKDYYKVLNDIYRVATLETLSADEMETIKQQLIDHGYEQWLMDTR